ncbi:MAG: type IX secretion system membrane protein PorP/SprF [bacterium]
MLLPCSSYALFDDLGMGARAPGMGNAFTAVADDLYSMHYNPAGLGGLERAQLGASHSLLHMGLSDGSSMGLSNLAFAKPIKAGKKGGFGAFWNQFSLSGVYNEQTLQVSYGRRLTSPTRSDGLFGGISLKRLTHSFSQLDEAFNYRDRLTIHTGEVDPVLSQNASKSAFDADIGLLYRFSSRYALGLTMKDVLQPNMAFSGDTDKVPMKLRLGGSYKSLWMTLAAELHSEKGPAGTADSDVIVAAERVFPSLDKGQFALRGALGIGSRDFRQVSTGVSYRINKIQFDYAFVLPMGTLRDTAGTHRLAVMFHFGGPTPEEQYGAELLDQIQRLGTKGEFEAAEAPTSLDDPRLARVKEKIVQGRFREAARILSEEARDLLPDPSIIRLAKRLNMVAGFYPEVIPQKAKWHALFSSGIADFLAARDRQSMHKISYAQSLNQSDVKLNHFLDRIEEITNLKADRVPPDFNKGLVEYKFFEAETAFNMANYENSITKLKEAMELEPGDSLALKRIGSAYFVMEDNKNALAAWEKAMAVETDDKEKTILQEFINEARKNLSMPVQAAPRPKPAVTARAPAEAKKQTVDVREIEKLYQKGVEYYAQGAHLKAASIFRRILVMDPENAQALKAIERIDRMYPKK